MVMAKRNQFLIQNDLPKPVTLNIEPEGAFFLLGPGEEVTVRDVFTTAPVTVKLEAPDGGPPIVSIWPGDGEVRVEKDGADVLELICSAEVANRGRPKRTPRAG
jgi:hypothetical protein